MELKTIRFPIVLSSSDDDEEPQETATDSQETDIRFYPEPIIEEILYRVPAKTVLYWKTVCKTWLSIIDDPTFSKTHFSRAPICPLLVFTDTSGEKSTKIMHLVEGQTVSDLDPRIGHKHNNSLVTSRTEFPEISKGPSTCRYLPLNSNVISCEGRLKKFKILRMYEDEDEDEDEVWWPEVLTVADKTRWRRVGFGTSLFDFAREIEEVVYVNGAIYWRHVELWVMDAYGDDDNVHWHKLYNVETETTRLEHSGVLGSRGRYKAIKYLECGGILMHDWRETFLVYDPVTKTERIFRVLEHSSARSCLPLQVVAHVPCLVKLIDALNLG
ncbi:hypothetical protein DH2020_031857 [Rehmannia glutinosa]|uniref:F-box domain-containing protein n=1 Tax=Rehmannia glutinosa TaxID=99300 RepID=A0ABR0VKW9_REHGL